MVANTSSATPPSASAASDDVAARRRPWHHSPFHVKIACDACAVAILLGVVALYLAVLLVA